MKKNSTYMTRALRSSDRRYALVLGKLGHTAPILPTIAQAMPVDELAELREIYQDVIGKRPYHGWDAETLKAKIAEARAA